MTKLMIKAAAAALVLASAAQAQEGDTRGWTLSASGGITAIQAQADQPFAAIGLKRDIGNSWV